MRRIARAVVVVVLLVGLAAVWSGQSRLHVSDAWDGLPTLEGTIDSPGWFGDIEGQ